MDDGLILAELLCARLCHDLAGSIGAIATGAEVLADELETASATALSSEALTVLTDSANSASVRLRFLRLAFGPCGTSFPARQIHDLVKRFFAGLTLDWQDASQEAWPADEAKIFGNVMLLARDCLPRGGSIMVRARKAGEPMATVTAFGVNAAPGESMAALRASSLEKLTPRSAQGYYTQKLQLSGKFQLICKESNTRIDFSIVKS